MSEPPGKAVFLSYAHEDVAAARRIAEALRAGGVEVWFDQSELRGGDAWDASIREQVETCSLFIPIISAHTQARREGYFRLEWHLAHDRTLLMAEGTPFLLPVVIDSTGERGALVPKSFLGVQWSRLPEGETPSAFVQRVQSLLGTSATPRATSTSSGARAPAQVGGSRRGFPLWAAGVIGVVVLGLAAYFALRTTAKQSPAPVAAAKPAADTKSVPLIPAGPKNGPKSIAVLPFTNMSEDKEASAFFADGMHEDILTNLALVHELYVTSRTTVMQYRDTKKPLRQIGEELGVAYVLEGSVRRAGNTVRITGQLIRADTDGHLWAEKFDRGLSDIFAIQSEIATAIAGKLQAVILPQEKSLIERKPTMNPAAYDLYLKSREVRNRPGLNSKVLHEEEANLEAAVKLDPRFAEAWAALAYLHCHAYLLNIEHTPARLERAKIALDTAVAIAPDIPEILHTAGYFYFVGYRDYPRALVQLETALRVRPNFPELLETIAAMKRRQGLWVEALSYYRRAIEFDPGNMRIANQFAGAMRRGRRYKEEALERRRIVGMVPNDLSVAFELALVPFQANGATAEADGFFARLTADEAHSREAINLRKEWAFRTGNLTEYLRLEGIKPNDWPAKREFSPKPSELRSAMVLAALGDLAGARERLSDLRSFRSSAARRPDDNEVWVSLARGEAILGNRDEALRCANKAIELLPESQDAGQGPYNSLALAFVYAWTGDKERAITEYARLLRLPAGLSVHEMKRSPQYFPLRGNPRWEALLDDPKNNAPLF